jgi:hypothetical protein
MYALALSFLLALQHSGLAQNISVSPILDTRNCRPTEQVLEVAQISRCSHNWTEIEKKVLKKVANGEPAVFQQKTDEQQQTTDEQRTLSGCFISELLTSKEVPAAGVTIRNAIIVGPVDLASKEVKFDVSFSDCQFRDAIDLKRSIFRGRLVFDNCTLAQLDAEAASVAFDMHLHHSVVKPCSTFLKSLHVGGDLEMNNSGLENTLNLTASVVAGDLKANQSDFHTAESGNSLFPEKMVADFDGMRVLGSTELADSKFYGYVGFGDGHFSNIFLNASKFYGNTNFTRTKVDGLFLDNANFQASGGQVPQQLVIEEMTFQQMSPSSWERLKPFADATQYTPEFYSNLEALFRRHGYLDEANVVFIAGKRRQRTELGHQLGSINAANRIGLALQWLANYALDKSLGYGRHLERALLLSGVIMIVGWFLAFRKEEWMMARDPRNATDQKGKYRGFWYSLDLFLPVVDFGDNELWVPKEQRRKSVVYRRIHMILGHILIPIGLAALTFGEIIK